MNISAKVTTWSELARRIDAAPPMSVLISHGLSRSLCGNKLLVDFGDELGEIAMAELTFRDSERTWEAYCRGVRMEIKLVKYPEIGA